MSNQCMKTRLTSHHTVQTNLFTYILTYFYHTSVKSSQIKRSDCLKLGALPPILLSMLSFCQNETKLLVNQQLTFFFYSQVLRSLIRKHAALIFYSPQTKRSVLYMYYSRLRRSLLTFTLCFPHRRYVSPITRQA